MCCAARDTRLTDLQALICDRGGSCFGESPRSILSGNASATVVLMTGAILLTFVLIRPSAPPELPEQ
jgi:hypothetical protein